ADGGIFKFPSCLTLLPGSRGLTALHLIVSKNWCWRLPFLICGGIFGSSEMQLYSPVRSL
ncbi:hypothetical protein Tco_0402546, partial [Tanacetum coccineum]